MKKLILLNLVMFLGFANTYSQMEKGDKYMGGQIFVFSAEGTTNGNIYGNFAVNVSKNIILSAGPVITISSMPEYKIDPVTLKMTSENSVDVGFAMQLDGDYYFSSKSEVSPFLGLGTYFSKYNTQLSINLGLNYFITKTIAWKTILKLGVNNTSYDALPGSTIEPESQSSFGVLFSTGLSYRF